MGEGPVHESSPGLDRTLRPFVLVLTLLFVASFLAGTAAPLSIRRQMTDIFRIVLENYRDLGGGTLFFNILVQNMVATFLVLGSGVFVGVIPTFAIGSNGFGLGVLYRQAYEASGYSKAALAVFPYGVFEIPALLVAASYGLWLGVTVVRRMRGKESAPLGSRVRHAILRYFAVVFPLLVVAAAMETALILWMR